MVVPVQSAVLPAVVPRAVVPRVVVRRAVVPQRVVVETACLAAVMHCRGTPSRKVSQSQRLLPVVPCFPAVSNDHGAFASCLMS